LPTQYKRLQLNRTPPKVASEPATNFFGSEPRTVLEAAENRDVYLTESSEQAHRAASRLMEPSAIFRPIRRSDNETADPNPNTDSKPELSDYSLAHKYAFRNREYVKF